MGDDAKKYRGSVRVANSIVMTDPKILGWLKMSKEQTDDTAYNVGIAKGCKMR